ncbi:peptidase T4 [Sneathiella sp. P13V-1]|uniref:P1 family peptidase n=1 Tax=Sneathiella sp. P13V-1 TaxID=2697366 RepID=UPI00187BC28B|nr:P1 family peptidase [Sneathiella sp. P13V-1]MBE7635405.1 peptidase T4 [Sneathiella sp. P13V-1]
MINPGHKNLITDVDGIKVGNSHDETSISGVTAIVPDNAAVAGVDVRGGGPGTRETEVLRPDCLVERVDAIVLSGGSVYGLEAASGAVSALASQKRGFAIHDFNIPIVPSAILFDMINGGDKNWGDMPPYRDLGKQAVLDAGEDFGLGNVGAGYGANAGTLKGGLGSCSAVTEGGIQVGAVIAVNPVGSVVVPGTHNFWAWELEQNNEFGGFGAPKIEGNLSLDGLDGSRLGANTTIGVVATNVAMSKSQLQRVAIMAQDGYARAIRPVHTPFDGDTIFAMSTEKKEMDKPEPLALAKIGAIAADCVARAVARAVYHADSLGIYPGYRELFDKK